MCRGQVYEWDLRGLARRMLRLGPADRAARAASSLGELVEPGVGVPR